MTSIAFISSSTDSHLLEGPEVHTDITVGGDTATLAVQPMHWLAEPRHPESVELVATIGGEVLELTPERALQIAPQFRAFERQLTATALQAIAFRDGASGHTGTVCARCDVDVDFAPADMPAPDQSGRRVCATETGEIGEKACGYSDMQLAIGRNVRDAGRTGAPEQGREWQAALDAALPLVDAISEALTAFVVRDETAWLAIANHMLAKIAERAPAPRGAE